MNRQECVALTRLVAAACPQQAIDDYTPDAWYELLDDLSLGDCREAVRALGRRKPFMAPAEIRAEVRRIRSERIAHSLIPAPPPELTDNPQAYRRALAAEVRRAADGHGDPAENLPTAIAAAPGLRLDGAPISLRGAVRELRRRMGPARQPRALTAPQDAAAEQAAESRRARGESAGEAS